jgi:hypothetical protein
MRDRERLRERLRERARSDGVSSLREGAHYFEYSQQYFDDVDAFCTVGRAYVPHTTSRQGCAGGGV